MIVGWYISEKEVGIAVEWVDWAKQARKENTF